MSRLARSGATTKQVKELARPSDVNLTMGRYAHAALAALAGAVNLISLPAPGGQTPDARGELATLTQAELTRLAVLGLMTAPLLARSFTHLFTPNSGTGAERGGTG